MDAKHEIYTPYKSHKTVRAFKILAAEKHGGDAKPQSVTLHPENKIFPPHSITTYQFSRHEPQIGGYWVFYDDGYESYSPADAFEAAYTLHTAPMTSPGPSPHHVFAGKPDARQSDSVDTPVSRFRPVYRALTPEQKAMHDKIKDKAAELEELFNNVGGGRYLALAHTDLESSIMWIVKQLTS